MKLKENDGVCSLATFMFVRVTCVQHPIRRAVKYYFGDVF